MADSSFPPAPVSTIDWSNIGFKVREVNGHVESHYSLKTGVWTAPEFVEDPFLSIHGMAPALNYGQQCYEGLKAFRSSDNRILMFRPKENAKRFAHSSEVVSIPPVPEEHFLRCVHTAVALNAVYVPPHETGASMYVRPLVFGSCAQLGLNPPEEYTFCVYVLPTGVYHGVHPVDALILEDFDRAAPRGVGSAKVGGNYAPVLRWSDRARNDGFGITLHLDSATRTAIDEFSTSGFVGIKNKADGGKTVVVPASDQIIKSITSDSVCELAKSFGWTVEHREIPYEEVKTFDEVMAAGTAAALVPIKSITFKSRSEKIEFLKSEDPGPACLQLLGQLKAVQQGKIKDSFGWCEEVKPAKDYSTRGSGGSGEVTNGVHAGNVDKLP
ncbi:MAG: hypothetical protein M1828_000013 [Chrysothrix sp. TS-e1954]|nr:MAG: hypothetical protein M1828_000013 [Chrysothrix sp. TS-e1954]